MNKTIILFICIFCCPHIEAQQKKDPNYIRIATIETDIKGYSNAILNDMEMVNRFRADSLFTRGLVQALKLPNSFYYPFDFPVLLFGFIPRQSADHEGHAAQMTDSMEPSKWASN